MRAITHAFMARLQLPEGPLLELGCGGGVFLSELRQLQPNRHLVGIDLHPLALGHAKQRLGNNVALSCAHMHCLPFPAATFGTIVALDSLDQQGVKLSLALSECRRTLRKNGLLFMRVSAYEWLRSKHDLLFGTGRRYTRRELQALLRENGFRPILSTYANTFLLPPVAIARVLQRYQVLSFDTSYYQSIRLNFILKMILKLEAICMGQYSLPFGVSFYVAAQRAEALDAL